MVNTILTALENFQQHVAQVWYVSWRADLIIDNPQRFLFLRKDEHLVNKVSHSTRVSWRNRIEPTGAHNIMLIMQPGSLFTRQFAVTINAQRPGEIVNRIRSAALAISSKHVISTDLHEWATHFTANLCQGFNRLGIDFKTAVRFCFCLIDLSVGSRIDHGLRLPPQQLFTNDCLLGEVKLGKIQGQCVGTEYFSQCPAQLSLAASHHDLCGSFCQLEILVLVWLVAGERLNHWRWKRRPSALRAAPFSGTHHNHSGTASRFRQVEQPR